MLRRSLLIFIFWVNVGFSAGFVPPYIKWYTVETPHFYIHFQKGLTSVAERVAYIAEKDYRLFEMYIEEVPQVKTHVILTYFTDVSNGFTLPFPHPAIYLYITPPSPYSELIYTREWLESLFLHEFSHVIYLERTGGFPRVIRKVFGRIYFPNLFAPYLITEGYAVWNESRFLGKSRLKSSYYNMILRVSFLEGKEEKYSSFSLLYPTHWPFGVVPYLYGSYILDYIGSKYGEECVDKFTVYYSANLIPFLVNNSFQRACGVSFKKAWDRLKMEIREKLIEEKEEVKGKRVTYTGNQTRGVRFINSEEVVYTVNNMSEYPYIAILNLKSGDTKKLSLRNTGYHLSVYQRKIYFAQMEYIRNFYLYSDIFIVENGKKVRFTKGGRWFAPEVYDGKVYGIKRTPSRSSICEVEGGECIYTTENEILSFRFSPDGKKVVFSEKTRDGRIDIGLIEIETGKVLFITEDKWTDLFPVFSPDGKYIIFSSDRNGVPNLYAKETTTLVEFQITDLKGGAFESDVSPDGRYIAYVGYSDNGFDLYIMDYNPTTWKRVEEREEVAVESRVKVGTLKIKGYTRYNGFRYLIPKAWVPLFWYGRREGFFTQIKTGGADPLFKHLYMLDFYYQWKRGKPGGSLLYVEDSFYPTISLRIAELPQKGPIVYKNGPEFWVSRFLSYIDFTFPLVKKMRWSIYGGFGYRFRWYRAQENYSLYSEDATGRMGDVNLWLAFDSRRMYETSFMVEEGIKLLGFYRRYHPWLGGEYSGEEWSFDFEGYHEFLKPVGFLKGSYVRYRGFSSPTFLPVAGINGDVEVKGLKSDIAVRTGGSVYGGMSIPLYLVDRGIGLFPLAFRYIYFSLYGGTGFLEIEDEWKSVPFVGFGLGLQMIVGYVVPITFEFEESRGFSDLGDWRWEVKLYLNVSGFFNKINLLRSKFSGQFLPDILNTGLR